MSGELWDVSPVSGVGRDTRELVNGWAVLPVFEAAGLWAGRGCGFCWGGFVEAGEAEGAEAADGPAAEVESVGEECSLPVAFCAEEVGFSEAVGAGVFAAFVARLLESGE
jgi:hypothetical protein